MYRKSVLVLGVILSLVLSTVAFAQEATPEAPAEGAAEAAQMVLPENAIVGGLNAPRGIAYDEAGNLYIAEAGYGGEKLIVEMEGQQVTGGITSQVTMVAPDGTSSVVLGNLVSGSLGPESLGLARAIPAGDSLWLVLSDHQNLTVFSDAVVEVDKATGRVKNYIELFAFEAANNPDGTEEIYSNPSDVAMGPDGKLYIVDTGMNALLTWTDADGLQLVKAWPEGPVPTAIEFAADNSIYIGFLGKEIAPGAGHIEHWSADGSQLIETFEGLTGVTDILVAADGSLYASQLYTQAGEQGPDVQSGNVVRVTSEGATPVAEGLNVPFGLAQAPDGSLAVSTGTAFAAPGTGAVVRIPMS